MTRKLGRLLVVALVVAAVVAPMSVASADVAYVPACHDIVYDATNPYHILITDIDFTIKTYLDQWDLWNERHHAGAVATATKAYLNFNMMQVVRDRGMGAPPAGTNYILFYDDSLGAYLGLSLIGTPLRINGTRWDDIMCGSPGPDVIRGLRGNDIIYGGPTTGDYALSAPLDNDIITGGPGGDFLVGGYETDAIEGRSGNDKIFGFAPAGVLTGGELTPFSRALSVPISPANPMPTADANDLWGGGGNDEIYAGDFNDEGTGGPGADLIVGPLTVTCTTTTGNNRFWGQGGNDTILGGACDDWIAGGLGDDLIAGQLGDDTIYGDSFVFPLAAGNDTIYGACATVAGGLWYLVDQIDVIYGGPGNDTLYGDAGADVSASVFAAGVNIIDPAGDDTIVGGPLNDTLRGGLGNDTIYGGFITVPTGVTTDGMDTLYGEAGNDTLYGGFEDDVLYGDDWLPYAAPHPFTGLEGTDTLYGGGASDNLIGGDKADTFYGEAGNDTLYGGFAHYVIGTGALANHSGDGDVDIMNGDDGNDTYYSECVDLDNAFEPNPVVLTGGNDVIYYVAGLFGYFESEPGDCTP